jgi:thioredoxin-like negative regulator of GroEL
MAMPTLALFVADKMVDRLVGYPGSASPIRAWIDKNVPAEAAKKVPAEIRPTA